MKKLWLITSLLLLRCSVLTEDDPDFGDSGLLKNSLPLNPSVMTHLVGNYTAVSSSSTFRGRIIVKSANSRVSLFSYDAETYAVFNVGCVNNDVIFEGKTRDPASQTTGLMRLTIAAAKGGSQICAGVAPTIPHVAYTGQYGSDKNSLNNTISLTYNRTFMIYSFLQQ